MPESWDPEGYIRTVSKQGADYWDKSTNQYNWAKDQFAKNRATADTAVKGALDTGQKFSDYSTGDRSFWEGAYKPAMQQQLDYAKGYTTPERMAANRATALAGTGIAFKAKRDAAERALGSYDIDPSSGRFAGLDAGLAAKEAATQAGVGTRSDRQTEMMGQQLLDNAIKTGSILPGQAANEAGVSLAAGNAAVNADIAPTMSGSATMGTPIQWAGLGNDMIKQWMEAATKANELNIAQQKQDAASSKGSGIGAALGILGGIAGNMVMPGIGGMIGGSLGSMAGGGAGPLAGAGSGSLFRRGGKVQRMQKGGPVTNDDEDMTDQFNTELSPEDEARYQGWIRGNSARHGRDLSRDNFDYDTRGQFKDTEGADVPLGHGRDTYKKPNHPTFSDESKYHGAGGRMGGRWDYDETGSETLQPHGYADGGMVDDVPTSIWGTDKAEGYAKGGRVSPARYGIADRTLNPLPDDEGENNDDRPYEDDTEYGMPMGQPTDENDIDPGISAEPTWLYEQSPVQRMAEGGMTDDESDLVDTPEEEMMGGGGGENMVPPEASPSGGEQTDDVHALLNEGEFVMPKDVTAWYGEKFFQNMIKKAYTEMQTMRGAQGEPSSPQQAQAVATSAPTFQTAGA